MSRVPDFDLVVPGPLTQRTGGYLYDARMVAEVRGRGGAVAVHEVPGRFPEMDRTAREALDATLSEIDEGRTVVLDGLAMGCAGPVLAGHAGRLRLLALVHHPLADEAGLPSAVRDRFRSLETEALDWVEGVIVTSSFTARRLGAFGVSEGVIRSVPPGTSPVRPHADPAEGQARLLCVGTLIPRKGQLELVRALGGLADRSWQCVLVGSGDRDPEYAQRVRDEITARGLSPRVRVAGELEEAELESEWRRATLFVLPSHYEGYGMALTEALAWGLPIVSTTGGAIPWTVPTGAAVLVPPGEVTALRDAIGVLLDDGDRRAELRRAARQAAAELPDWPEQAKAFVAAVQELVAR